VNDLRTYDHGSRCGCCFCLDAAVEAVQRACMNSDKPKQISAWATRWEVDVTPEKLSLWQHDLDDGLLGDVEQRSVFAALRQAWAERDDLRARLADAHLRVAEARGRAHARRDPGHQLTRGGARAPRI